MPETTLSDSLAFYYGPWVMRAAWMKVQSWYAPGEWYDVEEWLAWTSDPWRNLSRVASELSSGEYEVGPFPMIPYPKKENQTRHYVMPSVRDQVAFATYLVLLGPFLEARMPNVSFGNRLARARTLLNPEQPTGSNGLAREAAHPRWFRLPFSLGYRRAYDPFGSGYGLFRRLLQWLTNDAIFGKAAEEFACEMERQDPNMLPYRQQDARFRPWPMPMDRLFWVRLDLSLAYPSVDRGNLREDLHSLLRDPLDDDALCPELDFPGLWGLPEFPRVDLASPRFPYLPWIEAPRPAFGEHPWHRLAVHESDRLELADRLCDLLDQVRYCSWEEPPGWDGSHSREGAVAGSDVHDGACYCPEDIVKAVRNMDGVHRVERECLAQYDTWGIWRPDSHLQRLGLQNLMRGKFGLPTGLNVSGLLLNAALTRVDRDMCRLYESALSNDGEGSPRVVYLRFVDDVILLSQDWDALGRALMVLCQSLRARHLFSVNFEKVKPDVGVFRDSLRRFWSSGSRPEQAVKEWSNAAGELEPKDYVTRSTTNVFATDIVCAMSALGDQDLDERFGGPATDHVDSLLELLERPDDDEEVAADARAAFAVNRLATVAWPDLPVRRDGFVRDPWLVKTRIRLGAERALTNHPWRFRLWRAVLVVALRTSLSEEACVPGSPAAELPSKAWLQNRVLPLIRWKQGSDEHDDAWEATRTLLTVASDDPVRTTPDHAIQRAIAKRRTDHQRLRTSFHRAHFWRQWATCARLLQDIAEGATPSRAGSGSWTSYFSAATARRALEWFGDIGTWLQVLYPAAENGYWPECGPFLWWWEAEALLDALLAVSTPSEKLIARLGEPCPGGMRALGYLDSELVAGLLPQGVDLSDLRQALGRVMRWRSEVPEIRETPGDIQLTTNRALAWFTRCAKPGGQEGRPVVEYRTALLPRANSASDWAALARLSLWDEHPDLVRRLSGPFDTDPVFHDRPWRAVIALDEYAWTRRLALAHGKTIRWSDCLPIFDGLLDLGMSCRGRLRPSDQTSLLEAMYDLYPEAATTRSTGALEDAYVPEIGLPWPVAWKIACEAHELVDEASREHSEDAPIITPDTVHLRSGPGSPAECLSRSRKATIRVSQDLEVDREHDVLKPLIDLVSPTVAPDGQRNGRVTVAADVVQLGEQCRTPHPLYFFPYLLMDPSCVTGRPQRITDWNCALLFLWMASGGEHYLNRLYEVAPWQSPLSERELLRCELIIPASLWNTIDGALAGTLSGASGCFFEWLGQTGDANRQLVTRDIVFNRQGGWDLHVEPEEVKQWHWTSEVCDAHIPHLRVRLVQMETVLDFAKWLSGQGECTLNQTEDVFRDVRSELGERLYEIRIRAEQLETGEAGGEPSKGPDHLVVFPEWAVPYHDVRDLQRFTASTGVAVLAGLTPRELPRVIPVARDFREQGLRILTNEAVLILPGYPQGSGTSRDRYRVFAFRIRKPHASVIEVGLVDYLNSRSGNKAYWAFLPGISWYRFTYPTWGSFSVAICSDILDTHIWDWLRGRIQHLFVVAYNKDVDLFDQLSWTRAYELFANVAIVNQGRYGGTLAWTPKHSWQKRVFSVHGAGLGASLVVSLPVRELIQQQTTGLRQGIDESAHDWQRCFSGAKKQRQDERLFKTPAPNYRALEPPRPPDHVTQGRLAQLSEDEREAVIARDSPTEP